MNNGNLSVKSLLKKSISIFEIFDLKQNMPKSAPNDLYLDRLRIVIKKMKFKFRYTVTTNLSIFDKLLFIASKPNKKMKIYFVSPNNDDVLTQIMMH